MTSSDEMFAEAANNWDLERLYKAMAEAKWQVSPRARKGLTEREKLFLRGLLCGHSPAEIASQLHQSRKGVEVYISTWADLFTHYVHGSVRFFKGSGQSQSVIYFAQALI
jgi:DNA-binding NarL/FixJ family response regulator